MMQKVLHDVSGRALQLHGSLGTTHEMPFVADLVESFVLGWPTARPRYTR
jgi:acyl-CoA dehydrogenase